VIGQTVTVRRYEGNRYGDRVEVSSHVVQGAAFAPRPAAAGRGSAELTDRAATVVADAELYVPYGADITAQDVIELGDGTRWEVSGAPEPWRSPFSGWRPGAVVPLRRKTG
jgi:hypothetical protein